MIRIILPYHLRNLAQITGESTVTVDGAVTQRSVLDAIESRYPMLRGTIRDRQTHERRPFIRLYACEQDLSNRAPPDALLPDAVTNGSEPLMVIGALAGG